MVQALALGFALLVTLMLAGRWLATAPPRNILFALKWFGLLLAVFFLALLLHSGVLAVLLTILAALVPWLIRAMQVHAAFRYFRNSFGRPPSGWRNAGEAAPGGEASRVDTRFLRMTLDHDTGLLEGEVLQGPCAGRKLAQLSPAELAALWRDCQADPQSAQVLEAWLERHHPDWRAQAHEAPAARMTAEEAYAILGLAPGAGRDEIKAAHRRLMMACHPDHGGSDWLAARLNQAKDVLLPD